MVTPSIGMCFDRSFPAVAVRDLAPQVDVAGIDQLWFIEDCFFTAGVSLAATALALTERVEVGIGILPVVARNPAITAMEIATLCNISPGRFLPGLGHGVQDWMGQMGERTPSPLTTMRESFEVIRALLAGHEVTCSGIEIEFDRVKLDQPPEAVPSLFAGVQQLKSLALAGQVADGIILVEGAGPTYVSHARRVAQRDLDFQVAVFTMWSVDDTRRAAYEPVAPFIAELISQRKPALVVLPFFEEMFDRVAGGGWQALLDMPADYWCEFGAVGTRDDAYGHVAALAAAGVNSINIYPGSELDYALSLIEPVGELARWYQESGSSV
ncbi:MAG TPA: LLM class flavin-dependent oxidoreductase [Ilumatobacter sp.]|nr:LLM class flavin-dependent oxidoreductase [Ilumatobacter sp.]